jgi:hypothetical protein
VEESRTGAFLANTGKPDVANGWTGFMFLTDSSLLGRYTVTTGQVKVKIKITPEQAMKA